MFDVQLDLGEHVASGAAGRRSALEDAVRSAIRSGRLAAGCALPSTRALATDLGLSRSTVVAAYEQLAAEGYLSASPGSATRVADVRAVADDDADEVDVIGPNPAHDFRPGEPDAASFPRVSWQRSLRRVLTEAPDASFGYPDPRGVPALRSALAEYVARTRSVHASMSTVRIYGGFASSLGFIAEALRARGISRVAVECPMFPFHTDILRLAGLTTVPVRVDADGLDVERLRQANVRAVLVTPAHQYPTGATMSAARRADLVAWAKAADGWVIEDDYDGEFRYDRRPIGSLQGLDPDRVVYAGTASKSVGAAMRLSWLVVPEALRDDLFRVTHLRAGVSAIDQLALTDFIRCGALDRHVRQMRIRYQRRREVIRSMLATEAPWLDVAATAAGLHLTTTITDAGVDRGIDEGRVLEAAERASVGLFGLHTHHGPSDVRPGFTIGFSRPSEHHFPTALGEFAAVLRSVT